MTRIRASVLVLIVTMAPGVASAASSTPLAHALRLVAAGRALIEQDDLAGAARTADSAEHDREAPAELRSAAETIRTAIAQARGDTDEEIAHGRGALEWADRSGETALVRAAADALINAYYSHGRIDQGLALVNRRLSAASAADPNRALYLVRRAQAFVELRDPAAARQSLDDALPLAERTADARTIAQIHFERGILLWRIDRNRDGALREYDEALPYARRTGSPAQIAAILTVGANVLRASAGADPVGLHAALDRYEKALALARHAGAATLTSSILKGIGNVYRQLGDTTRAERVLVQTVDAADKADDIETRWMARMSLGTLMRQRDPVRAARWFADSIDVLESEANDMALGDLRAGTLAAEISMSDNPYAQFIDFLVANGHADRAFFVAERERARVLLDALSPARDTLTRQAPNPFSSGERDALGRIKAAQAALRAPALTDERRRQLVGVVDRVEAELADLRLQLAVDQPALAHARYPKLLTASDVQSTLLAPDEALVSYYVGASRSVAWVMTRTRLTAIPLPSRAEIEHGVREALQQLRDPSARGTDALTALSRTLAVERVAALAGTPRLIVIPHGILFDVPFEAMPDADGHPLVERFVVSYAPSASALAVLRSPARTHPAAATLIAVANPLVSAAPTAGSRQADLPHINLLSPVPYSAEEARRIAGLFGGAARVLDGSRARMANLRQSGLEHARILHFATHGLIDETRPERSGLVLTADPPRDDGLLQTRDIYGLRLEADLVTLSACETALGQNVTGEGMIGLTRAFFYAGARSVVASLWDVEDASTARLMQRFYANIRHGESIDAALRHAKIDFIRGGGPTSRPFYWASFIATGQTRTVVDVPADPASTIRLVSSIVAAAVAIVALVAMVWRRRRARPEVTAPAA